MKNGGLNTFLVEVKARHEAMYAWCRQQEVLESGKPVSLDEVLEAPMAPAQVLALHQEALDFLHARQAGFAKLATQEMLAECRDTNVWRDRALVHLWHLGLPASVAFVGLAYYAKKLAEYDSENSESPATGASGLEPGDWLQEGLVSLQLYKPNRCRQSVRSLAGILGASVLAQE